MKNIRNTIIAFGVNHEFTTLNERKDFALTPQQYENLLADFKRLNINNAIILNTCNRTEFYAESEYIDTIIRLYQNAINQPLDQIHQYAFLKKGSKAIRHIFEVAVGLQSKIPGDYQVVGQLRSAYILSKEKDLIAPLFERLFQFVFKTAKTVKRTTHFSDGTASHGYLLVHLLAENNVDATLPILLLGAGHLAKKITNHLLAAGYTTINVANRTLEKAEDLANTVKGSGFDLSQTKSLIDYHAIIVSTIPLKEHLQSKDKTIIDNKYLFDLTVEQDLINSYPFNKKSWTLDDIEQRTQTTLMSRHKEIEKVEAIIDEQLIAYNTWIVNHKKMKAYQELEEKLMLLLGEQNKVDKKQSQVMSKKITQLVIKQFAQSTALKKAI